MAKKKASDQPPAPPPARRRRGLAGRFDLLVAWVTRVAKGKDLTTKDKAIVGPLLVLGLAYYARGALAARSNAPVFNVSEADTLKSVFFSGDPWLVECTSATRSAALVDSPARHRAAAASAAGQPSPAQPGRSRSPAQPSRSRSCRPAQAQPSPARPQPSPAQPSPAQPSPAQLSPT